MAIRVDQSIMQSLSDAISKAQTQADTVESVNFNAQALQSRIDAANEAAISADNMANQHQEMKEGYEEQLENPPTKSVTEASGKKGAMSSRQVTDEAEVKAIKSKIAAKDVQVQQAEQAATDARSEATDLENQKVPNDAISSSEQSQLNTLDQQITELMNMVDDENTDLESDEFKEALQGAMDLSNELSDELSSSEEDTQGNSLELYWDAVGESFAYINDVLVDKTTITPEDVDPANNYNAFFVDIDESFDKLIAHLEENGFETDELDQDDNPVISKNSSVIDLIKTAKDEVINSQNNYLGGVSLEDETQMGMLLGIVNYLERGIDQDYNITQAELEQLAGASTAVGEILSGGGSAFNDDMQNKINAMDINLAPLEDSSELEEYQNFMQRFIGVFSSQQNTPFKLVGIKDDDVALMDSFNDVTRYYKDIVINGGTLNDEQAMELATIGNEMIDMLIEDYGFAESPSHDDNANSSGTYYASTPTRRGRGR